jgi:hypothetical protein
MDHWTPILSEEGSREIVMEQETRDVETPQRIAMLVRVRDAVRAIRRQDSRDAIGPTLPKPGR